eukprot:Pgem_evm1s14855
MGVNINILLINFLLCFSQYYCFYGANAIDGNYNYNNEQQKHYAIGNEELEKPNDMDNILYNNTNVDELIENIEDEQVDIGLLEDAENVEKNNEGIDI